MFADIVIGIVIVIIVFMLMYRFDGGPFSILIFVGPKKAKVVDNVIGRDRVVYKEGLNFKWPIIERVVGIISYNQEITIDPPLQKIITKDNIKVEIDMIAKVKIKDPYKARFEVDDYQKSVENLLMTSTLKAMAGMSLTEMQAKTTEISQEIKKIMQEDTKRWGIEVVEVYVESIVFPKDVQEAIERQIIAKKDKETMRIRAEGHKLQHELEAEAVMHEVELIKKMMPEVSNEKILEFLTSQKYVDSMRELSESDNSKLVVYPADLQKSMMGFLNLPTLDENKKGHHKKTNQEENSNSKE